MADQVRSMIHGDFGLSAGPTDGTNNYAIMRAANDYIYQATPAGLTVYGFVEPLRYLSRTASQLRDGSWFQGDPAEKGVGVSVTLSFGDARKIASLWVQN